MQASDFEELRELTNLCFSSKDYFHNFPQVFSSADPSNFFFNKIEGKIISFCAISPLLFLYNNNLVRGYCVGSVCTHPDHRGKGYASKLLAQAEQEAKVKQADLLFLFSEQNKLYENAGYQFCGKTYMAPLSLKQPWLHKNSHLKKKHAGYEVHFLSVNKLAEERILSKLWQFIIKNSHISEPILSYWEWKKLCHIQNMEISYLTHNQKIGSVCFLNKGDDFQNVVHGIYDLNTDYANLLIESILKKQKQTSNFYFFPGAFYEKYKPYFKYEVLPTMYIKVFSHSPSNLFSLFQQGKMYVRSLQGS